MWFYRSTIFQFSQHKHHLPPNFKEKINYIKSIKPYLIPFMHENTLITKSLFKSYGYLIFSKLCFFGGPLFLKHGINGLSVTGGLGLVDPLIMFFGFGVCYSGSVFFESLRNL